MKTKEEIVSWVCRNVDWHGGSFETFLEKAEETGKSDLMVLARLVIAMEKTSKRHVDRMIESTRSVMSKPAEDDMFRVDHSRGYSRGCIVPDSLNGKFTWCLEWANKIIDRIDGTLERSIIVFVQHGKNCYEVELFPHQLYRIHVGTSWTDAATWLKKHAEDKSKYPSPEYLPVHNVIAKRRICVAH